MPIHIHTVYLRNDEILHTLTHTPTHNATETVRRYNFASSRVSVVKPRQTIALFFALSLLLHSSFSFHRCVQKSKSPRFSTVYWVNLSFHQAIKSVCVCVYYNLLHLNLNRTPSKQMRNTHNVVLQASHGVNPL